MNFVKFAFSNYFYILTRCRCLASPTSSSASPRWCTDVARLGFTSAISSFSKAKIAGGPPFPEGADHVLRSRYHPQGINHPNNLLRLFVEMGWQRDVRLPALLYGEQTEIARLQSIRCVKRQKDEDNILLLTHLCERSAVVDTSPVQYQQRWAFMIRLCSALTNFRKKTIVLPNPKTNVIPFMQLLIQKILEDRAPLSCHIECENVHCTH